MSAFKASEKRNHVRYRMKDNLVAAMQGDCDRMACVVDLNRKGIGISSMCGECELTGKLIVLDLLTDRNRIFMRSLSARLVFSATESTSGNDPPDRVKRYGLQFVNLSALENRLIDIIIKKYALPV